MSKKHSHIISPHSGRPIEIEDREAIEQKKRQDEIAAQNQKVFEDAAAKADQILKESNGLMNVSVKVVEEVSQEQLDAEQAAIEEFARERQEALVKIGDFTKKPQNIHSFVDPNEEEAVKKLIAKIMQCEPFHAVGWQLAIRIHSTAIIQDDAGRVINPNTGKVGRIIVSQAAIDSERYMKCVGQVIAMGSDCYSDERFHEGYTMILGTRIPMRWIRKLFNRWMPPRTKWPLCKIGDWVVFPRYEGHQIKYKKHDIILLEDAKIDGVVQDPADISRE